MAAITPDIALGRTGRSALARPKGLARRKVADGVLTGVVTAATVLAVGTLLLVLIAIALRGLPVLSLDFFFNSPVPIGQTNGGVFPAIVGTLIMALIGAVIAVPVGMGVAIYLSEIGHGRLAGTISFMIDILAGMPSIVVGVLVWALLVRNVFGSYTGLAGGVALAIIMIPIIARTVQEMLALVPMHLREASYALGTPIWKTIVRIVIPTARAGIVTGIVLAVARAAGETAPLLLTALGSQFVNVNVTQGPMASLPVQIFRYAQSPDILQNDQAWGAAAILIIVIAILNLLTRLATRGGKVAR